MRVNLSNFLVISYITISIPSDSSGRKNNLVVPFQQSRQPRLFVSGKDAPTMPVARTSQHDSMHRSFERLIDLDELHPSPISIEIYGDCTQAVDDLLVSIRAEGVLVPLVVAERPEQCGWEVISGHRRLACARKLGLKALPCVLRTLAPGPDRRRAIIEYNRQRHKTFSQLMREADAMEDLVRQNASMRRRAALRQFSIRVDVTDCRNSDQRNERTDHTIARAIGLGGKDLYRQARTVWKAYKAGDTRARAAVAALDLNTKSIHAAYKDIRRRNRFGTEFKPTPYDVWAFRHDPAFGIPYPGSIPPAIVAHVLHYFTEPGSLVLDPMAGGGTILDVAQSMGRKCLAYDIVPSRPEILMHDVKDGMPIAARDCDLVFCDPPYHSMLSKIYSTQSISNLPLQEWRDFLYQFARNTYSTLKPGGHVALLLANQTEKDLPAGYGYIDHAFLGYEALTSAGFLPRRRISCPMSGGYLPQHVRNARADRRMLGLVRDLLVMRKVLN